MKRLSIALVVAALAVVGSAGLITAEETQWFDLTCGICKNMAAEEGLMDNLKWETHLIENGSLSVMQIAKGYQEKMERAHKHMTEAGEKLKSGEQMHLCGFCQSYGKLMMSGVKTEEIDTAAGHISLMTSEDAAVVKQIQAHAQRTIDEYEKWQAESKG